MSHPDVVLGSKFVEYSAKGSKLVKHFQRMELFKTLLAWKNFDLPLSYANVGLLRGVVKRNLKHFYGTRMETSSLAINRAKIKHFTILDNYKFDVVQQKSNYFELPGRGGGVGCKSKLTSFFPSHNYFSLTVLTHVDLIIE